VEQGHLLVTEQILAGRADEGRRTKQVVQQLLARQSRPDALEHFAELR